MSSAIIAQSNKVTANTRDSFSTQTLSCCEGVMCYDHITLHPSSLLPVHYDSYQSRPTPTNSSWFRSHSLSSPTDSFFGVIGTLREHSDYLRRPVGINPLHSNETGHSYWLAIAPFFLHQTRLHSNQYIKPSLLYSPNSRLKSSYYPPTPLSSPSFS